MHRFAKPTSMLTIAALTALAGCASELPPTLDDVDVTKADPLKADTSAEAVFLDFEFDAELIMSSQWGAAQQIESQLLYTIGHLNDDNSLARLDHVALSDVETTPMDDGRYLVSYHAKLPVAWGRRESIPAEYTFRLPRDMTTAGLDGFFGKYASSCVDPHAHDNEVGIYWYYYRTQGTSCRFEDADVSATVATVSQSPVQTTGRFPEYDEVWKDDVLRVVAIFGKYEDGATSGDPGITGYNTFLREIGRSLASATVETTPADLQANPGTTTPEVTFHATLANGKTVEVVAILVDNVRTAGAAFDARYAELSTHADFITYNGHAGLGANIQALAHKGRWTADQYAIVFMNGCDTFAYVDSALWDAHARVNTDDPAGTKTCDIVMNAMPSFFSSMPHATLAIFRALMDPESPRTYEQIFADVDAEQVVLVSGEQDNDFTPGGSDPTDPPPPAWTGLSESGAVARNEEKRFETPTLAAGTYRFAMTGTSDADLYVRIGSAPTQSAYDCRPYKGSSNETCDVELAAPAAIHVMIRGYAASSNYALEGAAR